MEQITSTLNIMRNKKVLVTGSCGFIGTNLVLELLEQSATVTALDLPSADWKRMPAEVTRIKTDIMNIKNLTGLFDDIEIIYHLAAKTDLDGKNLEDYKVNFEGTKNLINANAKNKNLERFVFYSTQLVVGLFNETRFIDENELYRTKTFYGESKINGELITKEYCKKLGINYTIIRPTSVYGSWGETPYREFFRAIKKRRYFHVGKAGNLVSWVYVKNIINLTILASLSAKAKNEIYFGNDFHPYTMREIVTTVADYYNVKILTVSNALITLAAYFFGIFKILGFDVPIYPFRLKNMKASYCYSIQKSILIGYNPQYNLKNGIKETLDWYEKNNFTSQ